MMTDHTASSDDRLFMCERDLAAHLGCHRSTLTRLAQQGKLPVQPVYVGHRRVYPRAAVEKLAGVA